MNTIYTEQGFAVRRDGLEMVFGADRPGGGGGGTDLWVTTRASTEDSWSEPVPLPSLNSSGFEGGKMSFSFDGRELYFRSSRSGAGDIYVATREKLRD